MRLLLRIVLGGKLHSLLAEHYQGRTTPAQVVRNLVANHLRILGKV